MPKLAGALRGRVRDDTEDPDRGEHETEHRERAEDVAQQSKARCLPLLRRLAPSSRRTPGDRDRAPPPRAQVQGDGIRLIGGPQKDADGAGARLREGLIGLRCRCRRLTMLPNDGNVTSADDADHLAPVRVRSSYPMRLPIGSSFGHSAARHGLVDHRHRRPSEAIVRREHSATPQRRCRSVSKYSGITRLVVGEHRSGWPSTTKFAGLNGPTGTPGRRQTARCVTPGIAATRSPQRLEEHQARVEARVVAGRQG